MLERNRPTRGDREAILRRDGFPAYTTSVGWLGYDDAKIDRLCPEALAEGWTRFKMKVGGDSSDDLRRGRMIRRLIGEDAILAIDANQRWGIDEAIDRVQRLAEIRPPYWIEEPHERTTSSATRGSREPSRQCWSRLASTSRTA